MTSYFDVLPVEILNHILGKLDVQTILFSFRCVCKRFHSITDSYSNYNLNFESTSKSDFHRICRLISFDRVVSLTLSNKDKTHGQIQLFLSSFNINQFIRLRQLTLIQIEDEHLKVILQCIVLSSLTSLSIDSQTYSIRRYTALDLLSSAIEHSTLQKLDLNMWPKDMNELPWPTKCTLRELRIRNSISIHQFDLILRHSPCLQTMSLKDFNIDDTHENSSVNSTFTQLRSLTCAGGRVQMDKLERCLSFTPALVHLKLMGDGNLFNSPFDGYRWEQFIESKLPCLQKFEFFVSVLTYVNFETSNVMEIISLFRTPFWLENKQWLVTCDYILCLHKLILFSMPICEENFVYCSEMNKVSASNFRLDKNDLTMTDNVNELALHLSKMINVDVDDDQTQRESHLFFRNITGLTLGVDGAWPKGSLRFLSSTLDFSRLVKLSLSVNFFHEYMPSITHGITKLLQQAVNIHSLSLFDYWAPDNCTTNMETVRSMITPNIKHLQIHVRSSDDIKFIIDSCEHLTSVTFEYAQNLIVSRGKFIDCLSDLRRPSSRWESQFALHVWLPHH